MEKEKVSVKNVFELSPVKGGAAISITKRKILLGSSESCDVVLSQGNIAAIHAVLEIGSDGKCKLYDMNSEQGSFINGNKVTVCGDFRLGDTLKFGTHDYKFQKFTKQELPPILDVLDKGIPPVMPSKDSPKLPRSAPKSTVDEKFFPGIPRVEYPLAKDPKAEFSEYIFEDVDKLYPIFKYDVSKTSIEVIILFKDKIYSVDYLPAKNGTYKLVGMNPEENEIEYACLGKDEKIPFIEIMNGEVFVEPLYGYETFLLSDTSNNVAAEIKNNVNLGPGDILRFYRNDLQIYIRVSDAPPKVKGVPIWGRDHALKKYIFFVFALMFIFFGLIQSYQVDKELEKDKIPERIATILYRKPVVSRNKAIAKTKKMPKRVQKAPKQVPVKKKKVKIKVKPKEIKKVVDKKVKVKAKKATPKKSPKIVKVKTVRNKSKKMTRKSSTKRMAAPKFSRVRAKSKGHVDTYKSIDFSSTVSSLLSKGGATKRMKTVSARSSNIGLSTLAKTGGESARLKRAKVSHKIGSLAGSATGKLDTSKGVEGLANKRSVYTVGMPAATVMLGSMDPDTIRAILMENSHHFRNCYQRILNRSASSFNGVLPLNFTIGASGHVTRAGIARSSGKLPSSVRKCVVNVLKGIKFPAPMGGGIVEVNQPMNFYRR